MDTTYKQKLFVDSSPSSLLLETRSLEPVWPVFTQNQYKLLAAICEKCYASVTEVEGRPQSNRQREGEVVYYPQHLSDAAALYGHLTNRNVRRLEDTRSLAEASVLLTHYEELTHELIEKLYSESLGDSVPGIICISATKPVHDQVLYYAATAHLTGPPADKAVAFNPLAPLNIIDCNRAILVGGNTPNDVVHDLLREHRALKLVVTHSDGLDAFWGERLTMCGIRDRLRTAMSPAPRCVESGWCHRQKITVDAALKDGRLLSPAEVSAWILFWGVCWGVYVNAHVNHTQWSVTRQFTEAHLTSAIVTSWSVELFSPDLVSMFVTDALEGMTVGQIVRRLISSTSGRRSQLRLCLMGDPRVRLYAMPKQSRVEPQTPAKILIRPDAATDGDSVELQFLKLLIETGPTDGPGAQVARELSNILTDVARSRPSRDTRSSVSRIQSLMTTYLSISGLILVPRWISKADYRPALLRKPRFCSWCLPRQRRIRQFVADICGLKRHFSVCSVCGIIEDLPLRSRLKAFVDANRIRLEGIPKELPWTGGILVMPQVQSEHLRIPWQCNLRDRPTSVMTIDQALPTGPIDVGIFFMFGLNLYILARRHRGPTIS